MCSDVQQQRHVRGCIPHTMRVHVCIYNTCSYHNRSTLICQDSYAGSVSPHCQVTPLLVCLVRQQHSKGSLVESQICWKYLWLKLMGIFVANANTNLNVWRKQQKSSRASGVKLKPLILHLLLREMSLSEPSRPLECLQIHSR